MSAALLEWPVEPDDDVGIALWHAADVARATGGTVGAGR